MKKAFTLAEIMIVLSIIAVLTAILLPTARNVMPNKKLMKFKKAHNTLYSAISELVNSDKYYLNGDLGVKSDGNEVDSPTYFCETLADVLNAKKINCSNYENYRYSHTGFDWDSNFPDQVCAVSYSAVGIEIELVDDVVLYQGSPAQHFAYRGVHKDFNDSTLIPGKETARLFGDVFDDNGMDRHYKIFCIDIDGQGKGEKPFGYGIRADGKIFEGLRAQEWLEKSIQEKD